MSERIGTMITAALGEANDRTDKTAQYMAYWDFGGEAQQQVAATKALALATMALVAEQHATNLIAIANSPDSVLVRYDPLSS